jgi:hypothetical protein
MSFNHVDWNVQLGNCERNKKSKRKAAKVEMEELFKDLDPKELEDAVDDDICDDNEEYDQSDDNEYSGVDQDNDNLNGRGL